MALPTIFRGTGGDVTSKDGFNLGDLVIVLLAGTLAGLRDHLRSDGFERAADLVSHLTDTCDEFLAGVSAQRDGSCHNGDEHPRAR